MYQQAPSVNTDFLIICKWKKSILHREGWTQTKWKKMLVCNQFFCTFHNTFDSERQRPLRIFLLSWEGSLKKQKTRCIKNRGFFKCASLSKTKRITEVTYLRNKLHAYAKTNRLPQSLNTAFLLCLPRITYSLWNTQRFWMPENYSQSKPTIMKSDDSPVWCGLGTTKFHLKMPMHISEHFLSSQEKNCLFFFFEKGDRTLILVKSSAKRDRPWKYTRGILQLQ